MSSAPNPNKMVVCGDPRGGTRQVRTGDLEWRPAAYAVIVKDGKILLAQLHGRYSLPGGGIEHGETAEQAVIREVFEETGITIANPRLLTVTNDYFGFPEIDFWFQGILFFYQCDYIHGDISTKGFDEYEREFGGAAAWINLNETGRINIPGPSSLSDLFKLLQ